MSGVRTLMSAISILVGVALFASWFVANVVVSVVEGGAAAREMTTRALDSPALIDAIGADISDLAGAALHEQGINIAVLERDGQLTEVMTQVARSPEFRTALLNQVEGAQAQVNGQLTDPGRPPAPLTISVDVSEIVGGRVGDLEGPAAALRSLELKPVDIRILEAGHFEQARDAYATVRWVHTWGLWLALGVLAVGYVISCRKRWFVAKTLLGVAGASFGIAGVVTLWGHEGFIRFLPGSDGGVWASLWQDVVGPQAAAAVIERSLLVGALTLVGGFIAVAIGAAVGKRGRDRLTDSGL